MSAAAATAVLLGSCGRGPLSAAVRTPQHHDKTNQAYLATPRPPTARSKRSSLWYDFEAQVKRLPATEQCLWSRAGSYTWRETHAHGCRYASFLLDAGVQPNTLVAFYLQNSADFIFALLGAWAVGSAPALINYNLGGQGLVHCLKISGAKVLLVDADEGCRQRIEEVRGEIEGALGMTIVVVDEDTKAKIAAREPKRPEDKYREGVKPTDPMCLMYTRYVRPLLFFFRLPLRTAFPIGPASPDSNVFSAFGGLMSLFWDW